jgi:hypothetical protein
MDCVMTAHLARAHAVAQMTRNGDSREDACRVRGSVGLDAHGGQA